ncbi:MAG: hypothetical protein WDO06_02745 [Actinomycetota bacterium]
METFIFSLIVQNFDFESDAQADQLDWDKADIYASNLDGQAIFTLASVQDVQDRLSFALEAIAFLNGLDPAIEVLAVASISLELETLLHELILIAKHFELGLVLLAAREISLPLGATRW